MQYKTIVLELLQQRPEMHNQLRSKRMLLPTLERYASELKASHEAWKDHLSQARPGSDRSQIASEALEIALKELQDRLPSGSPPDENEPLSVEGAMAFIRRHTPPA
jgi:hypothetical protein